MFSISQNEIGAQEFFNQIKNDVEAQNKAYSKAREVFENNGRKIYNASAFSKLDIFDKVEFNDLFL